MRYRKSKEGWKYLSLDRIVILFGPIRQQLRVEK